MMTETEKTYSEVYGILNMLGNEYISKIPSGLYEMIKNKRGSEYSPRYNENMVLEKQNVSKKALSMVALIHLNYWCDSVEEKNELKKIFKENEEEKNKKLREEYSIENLFNKNMNKIDNQSNEELKTNALMEVKEENIIKKIFSKIKSWFIRN